MMENQNNPEKQYGGRERITFSTPRQCVQRGRGTGSETCSNFCPMIVVYLPMTCRTRCLLFCNTSYFYCRRLLAHLAQRSGRKATLSHRAKIDYKREARRSGKNFFHQREAEKFRLSIVKLFLLSRSSESPQ